MKRLYYLTLVLAFGFSGCNHSGNRLLDQADHVMDDDPQLAYRLLDSIDSRSLRHREDYARYALLYTEALYKNYKPIENDSLIMEAVRYYSDHKNPELLFRSYYCLGCVYSLYECYTDAVVAFTQAEKLIDYEDSDFRKGLLYSRMGDIFYFTYDYTRAESYFKKAVNYFDQAGRDYYLISAKGMVANCKAQMGDYKSAITLCDQVIDWAVRVDSVDLLQLYMTNKMAFLVYDDNLSEAKLLIDSIKSKFGLLEENSDALYNIARYYIKTKEYDNARIMLDRLWTMLPIDSANSCFAETLLYEKIGQLDSALYYYRKSMDLNKALVMKVLNQPVMGAQRDYYRKVSELEALKAQNKITSLIASIIILLLIIFSSALFRINRKRKTKEQIRANIDAISELTARDSISQETIHNLNSILKEKTESIDDLKKRILDMSDREIISKTKIQLLNSKVREMLRQQYTLPDYLYTRYYEQFDDGKKAERLYKVVKNQIAEFTSPRNIERLDQMLKDTFGDLMDKLSSPAIGLQEKELLLLRLILTDISAKSMAAILNDTNQNINQRKKRLLEKIGRKDSSLLVELNAALSL